jgi:hypothetical protein
MKENRLWQRLPEVMVHLHERSFVSCKHRREVSVLAHVVWHNATEAYERIQRMRVVCAYTQSCISLPLRLHFIFCQIFVA